MTKKKAVDNDMVDALEIVLERADWVSDRLHKFFDEEYDVDEVVQEWVGENVEQTMRDWLDDKYDEFGPDGKTFEQIVRDSCHTAVKNYMTEKIMLMLLDEVRANMGKLLGKAVSDYVNSINQEKGTTK